MHLDLEVFRVLNAVVTEGSFSRAAEKLNKAQSAISYQMRKLEERVGVPVFDRSGYRSVLTPEGEAIWLEGQQLLAMVSRIEDLVDQFSTGWEPRLELIVDGSLPLDPVLDALKELVDARVPTKVDVHTAYLGMARQLFNERGAELLLTLHHDESAGLEMSALPEQKMLLVCAKIHPLSNYLDIPVEQLRGYVFLALEPTMYASAGANKSKGHGPFQILEFDADRTFHFSDYRSLKEALLKGLGFAWVPEYLIADELVGGTLIQVDYEGSKEATFQPSLVRRKDKGGRTAEMLSDLLMTAFSS